MKGKKEIWEGGAILLGQWMRGNLKKLDLKKWRIVQLLKDLDMKH